MEVRFLMTEAQARELARQIVERYPCWEAFPLQRLTGDWCVEASDHSSSGLGDETHYLNDYVGGLAFVDETELEIQAEMTSFLEEDGRARARDELAAQALGDFTPVRQVLDLTAERTALWLEMVRLAQDVADERRSVTCRCVGTHEPGCPVALAQQILARLAELQP
jgi:hypothetical protein